MYLIYACNRNIEGTANAEITLRIKHVFEFIHRVINNKLSVVECFEEVQTPIAEEISNIICFNRHKFLPMLYKKSFPLIFGLQFLLQFFYKGIHVYFILVCRFICATHIFKLL